VITQRWHCVLRGKVKAFIACLWVPYGGRQDACLEPKCKLSVCEGRGPFHIDLSIQG
jgi:hypothetical protein